MIGFTRSPFFKPLLILTLVLHFDCLSAADGLKNAKLCFKVGAINSTIYNSRGINEFPKNRANITFGSFFYLPLNDRFVFQPELLFARRGFSANGTIAGNDYTLKRSSDYLDVPLLVGYKPESFMTLFIGPQFSRLLHQTDRFSNDPVPLTREYQFARDRYRKHIFCITGGIDININDVLLVMRVGWDMEDNRWDDNDQTPKYKNVWYQLAVGIVVF
ncbi:MAG TPA: porin family protein [Bacteroidia bacterium]